MSQVMSSARCAGWQGLLVVLWAVMALVGCATHGSVVIGPEGGAHSEAVSMPAGHRPPPGQCRIWFPGRPPGQQPPPGDCLELRHRVPPGAYLVRG